MARDIQVTFTVLPPQVLTIALRQHYVKNARPEKRREGAFTETVGQSRGFGKAIDFMIINGIVEADERPMIKFVCDKTGANVQWQFPSIGKSVTTEQQVVNLVRERVCKILLEYNLFDPKQVEMEKRGWEKLLAA
ncbi:putative phage integrase [Pseudomonas phage PhiPA3]|uniref:Putative phage integrase n=1 Tax=Pseudomonas phage PhiPA3 TaxID=998086 RepID=F8SJI7_BPPA3|nr:putative phage integrase [Pseudomonas phage PhiPA3]AEH03777.1 putative phage integrase [Pseudomonas phage PhiPA3]